jgi:hypothetical protein
MGSVEWMLVTWDGDQWQALMSIVLNLGVP